jgi:hypothetical protein
MLEDPDFVPFIRTWEWSGVVDCHTRPLFGQDTRLVVAYGIRGVRDNTYLTSSGFSDSRASSDDVHATAIAHLHAQEVPEWTVEYVGSIAIAMRSGNEMVSADIINPEAMRELNEFFHTELIYVSMPTLFSMVASAHPHALTGIANAQFRDAQQPRGGALTHQVLILSDGHIVGSLVAQPEPEADPGWQAPEERAHAISTGLACVSILVDRAKNITGNSSATTFWPCFARHLGQADGELFDLLETAQAEFASARTRMSRAKHLIDHIEIMAGSVHTCVPDADYQRFARAVIAAATAISQAGTGFWGIGRTLPLHLRLTIQALSGILRLRDTGQAPRGGTLP